MTRGAALALDATAEISMLIERLHDTDKRLEALLVGEVDTVVAKDGAIIVLRRAQRHMHLGELAKQAAILNALPEHIALLDAQGSIVAVNDAWRRYAQENGLRAPDGGVGLNYLDVCDVATGSDSAGAQKLAVDLGDLLGGSLDSFLFEYVCAGPQGDRWFRLTATSLHAAPGGGAVLMHTDISAQKLAADTLQRTADLLGALVAGTPDNVFVKDLEGRYLLCNEAFARFAGRTVEEMIGMTNTQVFDPQTGLSLTSSDRQIHEHGGIFSSEDVLPGSDGPRTFVTTKAPYRDAAGQIIGVFGISHDITDRKRIEVEHAHQRQILRTLIDALPDEIYTKDAECRYVASNRALQRLFGLRDEGELAGKTAVDLMRPEAAARARQTDLQALEGSEIINFEECSADQSGNVQWRLINKVPLRDSAGEVTGIVGIERDVTALKRDQEHLRELNVDLEARVLARTRELSTARDQAQQANQAKSSFLAAMTHEIRTPMNGVIGMLEVLSLTRMDKRQHEMTELIRESAFALLAIIDDVLDFSKIEAGKLTVERVPMQIAGVVAKVCALLEGAAGQRGVTMDLCVDPLIGLSVLGDAGRLRQVLTNLIGNAIKFCGSQASPGRVGVKAALVSRDGPELVIELAVSDNGIGMDPSTQARLFTPFEQADASTTRRFGGTGLGLAISHTLVELMGGTISVRSALQQGSTFTVRLPFTIADAGVTVPRQSTSKALASAPLHTIAPDPQWSPLLLLVAEDNETNRQLIGHQLRLIGCEAVFAEDGTQALTQWRHGRFDLLLTDLRMPGMDGFALAQAIRAEEPTGTRLPIVALTANGLGLEEQRCRDAGMDGYLIKPVRLEQLRAMIDARLRDAPPARAG